MILNREESLTDNGRLTSSIPSHASTWDFSFLIEIFYKYFSLLTMTPCSFIRGNVSEELPAFMFNTENCVPSLKMQAAVSSGILINV